MSLTIIPFAEGEANLDWLGLCAALQSGHERPKAEIGDTFLYRGPDTLLNRAAWIDGMGIAVKSATLFPGNPARGGAVVNGGVNLYSDTTGTLEALVDFHLVTKWKTAGDSLYAATRLARPDSTRILIVARARWAGRSGRPIARSFPRRGLPSGTAPVPMPRRWRRVVWGLRLRAIWNGRCAKPIS